MGTGEVPPDHVSPVVFNAPTLGAPVCLGELYNQRKGQFLGVQLYPYTPASGIAVVDIKHTELSLSLSNTHEQRANLLDIKAKLSLDILGGLVKVSGSAAYLNDSKSNTNEFAYALALKMRLKERRLLFAETALIKNRISPEKGLVDYFAKEREDQATHFVSSIVYGGNIVVNLVARKSKLSKEEKIEGKLRAQFDKIKGAISLDGEVEANIKDDLSEMNDKFDLTIHGDVALGKVPVNPQDVLHIFPEAASLVTSGGGVPISVTLQPIPSSVLEGIKVYQLKSDYVDELLKKFAKLGDLHNRFSVLEDGIHSLQTFVPALAYSIRKIAGEYATEYGGLLNGLGQFLRHFQATGEIAKESIFADKEPLAGSGGNETNDESGVNTGPDDVDGKPDDNQQPKKDDPEVFQLADNLYRKHASVSFDDKKSQYPTTLVGLENEFARFRDFASDVQSIRVPSWAFTGDQGKDKEGEDEHDTPTLSLGAIDDVSRAIRLQDTVPLFIMTPFRPTPGLKDSSPPESPVKPPQPDLLIIRFLAILRRYIAYFVDASNPAHILYAENLKDLQDRLGDVNNKLPDGKSFSELDRPSFFIGHIDEDGGLSWSNPPPASEFSLDLRHKPSENTLGDVAFSLGLVNGTQSFTFQIWATLPSDEKAGTICVVKCANNTSFLSLSTPLAVQIEQSTAPTKINASDSKSIEQDNLSLVTFVQDVKGKKWILYLNGECVGEAEIEDPHDFLAEAEKLRLAYSKGQWDIEVHKVKAFMGALTKGQIAAMYVASKNEE